MAWAAAALVLVAGELLGASQLRELGDSDDARAIPHLESALELRLEELERFPGFLAPPDLEEEIIAAMLSLERLEPERALLWARTILKAPQTGPLSPAGNVSVVARRVLARSGDRSVVALALNEYFQEPIQWHEVLADAGSATHDVRLRDFSDFGETRGPPSAALLRSRIARALGELSDPPSEPSFEHLLEGDSLEIQRAVLALGAPTRYRAMRFLASRDHASLIGLPMTSDAIDRLYPYLAISRHRELRERVHRAREARGRALASLLLSPQADRDPQRIHAEAMRDAWFDAMAALGRDVLTPIVGEASVTRELGESSPSAGMVYVRSPEARVRLEQAATPDAIRWLGQRADTALSMPILAALRAGADEDVRLAAEVALLRLGAPGSSAFLQSRLSGDSLERLLPAVTASLVDVDLIRRAIEQVARRDGKQPVALVAMSHFHERYPREFLAWLDADDVQLRERAHFVMALSGDPRRLPLLIELAVAGTGPSRDAGLRGLSEANLGDFEQRLHRLAGDPNRCVRFQAALALVPTGQEWALRLLVAELDERNPAERLRARRAVERLSEDAAHVLLETLVANATASPFAVELALDLSPVRDVARWDESLWRVLAPHVAADELTALLAAARLSHPEATAAVERFLERPERLERQ